MRPRLFVVLLTIVVGIVGLATVVSRGTKGSSAMNFINSSSPPSPAKPAPQDPKEIVDGAQTPERIPDRVAYTLVFRFLSGRDTEAQKNSARSYLRMVFGCDTCPGKAMTKEQRAAAHINIERLLAAAEDFDMQSRPVDDQAKRIRERTGSNRDLVAMSQLKSLQAKKEALVMKTMASLPNRLEADGAEKLHRFVIEQFKRRVKIHAGHKPQTGVPGNAI